MKLNAISLILLFFIFLQSAVGQQSKSLVKLKENYTKQEVMIPMRDGVKLYTAIYTPKDQSKQYPILLNRTPYSCSPYGKYQFSSGVAPNELTIDEEFIFIKQDVRGKFMSEGDFDWVRPIIPNKTEGQIDESTDTWDTIDWIIQNVRNHNGKVGLWGGSYPGYYVMTGIVDAHPALICAIPSAPMVDLWKGDDLAHNGAFMMPHNLNFISVFGQERPEPTKHWPKPLLKYPDNDGYKFWLDIGPLKNVNPKIFKHKIIHWEEYINHPVYDSFWQSRDISQHLTHVRPAVMTIGGWFDSQDLYGPMKSYQTIEKHNPGLQNTLVFGPWYHVGWSRGKGDHCAGIQWESNTAQYYREHFELPFWNYHLKGTGSLENIPEVLAFDTGAKKWSEFSSWPPAQTSKKRTYLTNQSTLVFAEPHPSIDETGYISYTNDPENPVPFTAKKTTRFGNDWMVEDQRFLEDRDDVITFTSPPFEKDWTVAGPIHVHLVASSSGTDADYIVKVIDVYPESTSAPGPNPKNLDMSGYQMLLRGDPIRAKFRNSLEHPEPMTPNQPTEMNFDLRDVHHTFKKGHQLIVQIHGSWFPMIDRNPHKFVDLFNDADEEDFVKAEQRIYFGMEGTYLEFYVKND